jgi:hypothetical protein
MIIPDEVLLLEILVRLPVKSLVRFKSVCKAWCATIASGQRSFRPPALGACKSY